jgi:hypothetical protein
MKPLQRYAEDQQPATVTAAERAITLPNGQHLSKGCYPKRTGLYPFNSGHLCSFWIRLSDNSTHLINWLSRAIWTVVALFSWVVLHVPIITYDLVINHKHHLHQSYHDHHSSFCKIHLNRPKV